jgi:hypothetical protein
VALIPRHVLTSPAPVCIRVSLELNAEYDIEIEALRVSGRGGVSGASL